MEILVCVDFSESTEPVLNRAKELAQATSAKLWILHVADPEPAFVGFDAGPQTVRDAVSDEFHKEHRLVQELAEKMRAAHLEATPLMVQGATAETIIREAAKLGADMIVVGSHGKGALRQLVVGSVSEGVIRKAECPVLVVPTRQRGESGT